MEQVQAPARANPSPITAVGTDHDQSPQTRRPSPQPEAASAQHIISSARAVCCFPARKPFVALNKMAEGSRTRRGPEQVRLRVHPSMKCRNSENCTSCGADRESSPALPPLARVPEARFKREGAMLSAQRLSLKRMKVRKIDVQCGLLRYRFYRQLQPAGVAGNASSLARPSFVP